jgi:hypothetical protein
MDKPRIYGVLVHVEGYPDSEVALAERIRRTLETHPTLSLRVEGVVAREVAREDLENFAELMTDVWTEMDGPARS